MMDLWPEPRVQEPDNEAANASRQKEEDEEDDGDEQIFLMQMAQQARDDRENQPPSLTSAALKQHDSEEALLGAGANYQRKRPAASPGARTSARSAKVSKVSKAMTMTYEPALDSQNLPESAAPDVGEADSSLRDAPETDWLAFLQVGWEGCICPEDLHFDDVKEFKPFQPPKKRGTDTSKWHAALKPLEQQLQLFHTLLVENGKPNDQSLKSASSALKRAAGPKARKAVGKEAAWQAHLPLLTDKIKVLGELCMDLKTFRAIAMQKNVKVEEVERSINAVWDLWKKLTSNHWVAVPNVWVQSWVSELLSFLRLMTDHLLYCLPVALIWYDLILKFWIRIMNYVRDSWLWLWLFCSIFTTAYRCFVPEPRVSRGNCVPLLVTKLSEQQAKGDVDDELMENLKLSVFLIADELEKGPTSQNAFGKFADFFFWTKGAFNAEVQQLQLRLLGTILVQIFNEKDTTSLYEQIRKFFPSVDLLPCAILSGKIAHAMSVLVKIVMRLHTAAVPPVMPETDGEGGDLVQPEENSEITVSQLLQESECLKASNITKHSRALAKFCGTPGFKRLLRDLQAEQLGLHCIAFLSIHYLAGQSQVSNAP